MANLDNFLAYVQHWAEQIVALVESMKAWFEHFFPAEEEGTTAE